jgi:hypothetical protein
VCFVVAPHCIAGPSKELGDQDQLGSIKEKRR